MIYWILALAAYAYLCVVVTTAIAPKLREDLPEDESTIFVVASYGAAVLAAYVWPVTLLIAIPTHIYLRSQRTRERR